MKLNVGCGTHRAEGWINTDAHKGGNVAPIEVLCSWLPFRSGAFEQVLLSHVMEHVPWVNIPAFLADVRGVLADDGEVCVVGPDVTKTLHRWREGLEPWELVVSVMEHAHGLAAEADWPEARHWWNFTQVRAMGAMIECGFTVECVEMGDPRLDAWPLVGRAEWQSALFARKAPS